MFYKEKKLGDFSGIITLSGTTEISPYTQSIIDGVKDILPKKLSG